MQDAPTIEDLLDHRDWLRELARSLVFDSSAVDDVVQETWLAALRRPPKHRENLRSWLAEVLRRTASRSFRSQRSRWNRERAVAATEGTPSSAELVDQARAQRELVSALLDLDEPLRHVLLLRHFEGMPPREIARHLDVPVNTVHTRIQRGHARLRTRLGERYGDEWRHALLPMVGSATATTTGVATWVIAALVLFVGVGALGYRVFRTPPPPRDIASAPVVIAETAPDEGGAPAADGSMPEGPVRTPAEVPEGSLAPPVAIESKLDDMKAVAARVVDTQLRPLVGLRLRRSGPHEVRWQGGDPVWIGNDIDTARISLEDQARLRYDRAFAEELCAQHKPAREWRATLLFESIPEREVVTARGGMFPMESIRELGTIDVVDRDRTVLVGGSRSVPTQEELLVVARAVEMEGRVVDAAGAPIARVRVEIDEDSLRLAESRLIGDDATRRVRPPIIYSDAEGRFLLRRVPVVAGGRLRLSKGGYFDERVVVPGVTRRDLVVTLSREATRTVLAGRVQDRGGQPLADAEVHLGAAKTRADDHGRFHIENAELDDASTLIAVAAGYQALVEKRYGARVLANPESYRDVTLTLDQPSLAIAGHVVWDDGRPLAGARVNLADPTLFDSTFSTVESRSGSYERSVPVEPGGAFEITGLSSRAYRLRIYDASRGLVVLSDPIEAGTSAARVVIGADQFFERVRGRVVDVAGEPLVDLSVAVSFEVFRNRSGGGTLSEASPPVGCDEDGWFELTRVPRAHASLVVGAEDSALSFYPVDVIEEDGRVTLVYPTPGEPRSP